MNEPGRPRYDCRRSPVLTAIDEYADLGLHTQLRVVEEAIDLAKAIPRSRVAQERHPADNQGQARR